jgi:hypothetical protein
VKYWKPEKGDPYFFISYLEDTRKPVDGEYYVSFNGIGFLFVGEAISNDPDTDCESNCFRTHEDALRSLIEIENALRRKSSVGVSGYLAPIDHAMEYPEKTVNYNNVVRIDRG